MAETPIRDAATVLLLRDAADGVEVYLLRRVRGMPFAGGMTAYPGGGVDPRDADVDVGWTGPPPADWAHAFGCPEPLARALVCAAVRETFEESGVLLAAPPDGEVVVADDETWEGHRRALLAREISLAGLLAATDLRLRADLLRPWAHWVTPPGESRRYDTRFFAAALPADVSPRDVSGEADEAVWISPAQALAELEQGTRPMLTPTRHTLAAVAEHATVAEVLAAAPRGAVGTVRPVLERDGEHDVVVLPDGTRERSGLPLTRR